MDTDIFLSTPSVRRTTAYFDTIITGGVFLSTPSVRRTTQGAVFAFGEIVYFYPRPPCGGRQARPPVRPASAVDFYPRPPCGGRHFSRISRGSRSNFYPRPPCGGRPFNSSTLARQYSFLSTPSVRRATSLSNYSDSAFTISIHALRAEGDSIASASSLTSLIFLSTPSVRRATPGRGRLFDLVHISIHALRAEGDGRRVNRNEQICHFYPRPPCGGRRSIRCTHKAEKNFYPRPPCGGRRAISRGLCHGL